MPPYTAAAAPPRDSRGGVERLLLAFEELVSNAVRHGRSPVEAAVTDSGHCWLLEVADAEEGTPPIPHHERNAAPGGLDLGLVAKIGGAHVWEPLSDGRTVVWARVDFTSEESAQFSN